MGLGLPQKYGEQKTDKEKSHKGIVVVGMSRERPGDRLGTSQRHPGRLGRFMWKFTFKGQNVRGTDGTDDGTDGTCSLDRRDTNQGVSRQNSLCLLLFFSPRKESDKEAHLSQDICQVSQGNPNFI